MYQDAKWNSPGACKYSVFTLLAALRLYFGCLACTVGIRLKSAAEGMIIIMVCKDLEGDSELVQLHDGFDHMCHVGCFKQVYDTNQSTKCPVCFQQITDILCLSLVDPEDLVWIAIKLRSLELWQRADCPFWENHEHRIHQLIKDGDLASFKFILDYTDWPQKSRINDAIRVSIRQNKMQFVQLLVQSGLADVSCAAWTACNSGKLGILRYLSTVDNFNSNYTGYGFSCLDEALLGDHTSIVKFLLSRPEVLITKENISRVLDTYSLELVKLLMKHPSMKGTEMQEYCLKRALLIGNLRMVKYLERMIGIDHVKVEQDAFNEICVKGHINVVKYLVLKSQIYPVKNTALLNAISNDHLEVVKFLASLPGALDGTIAEQALEIGCIENHKHIVEFLLSLPQVDPSANNCKIFIDLCARADLSWDITKLFLEDGRVDPTARNNEALIKAAESGKMSFVTWLLSFPGVHKGLDRAIEHCEKLGHLKTMKNHLEDMRNIIWAAFSRKRTKRS